jgi:predicted ATP-grasp superfamily ATP-dependent carboligase
VVLPFLLAGAALAAGGFGIGKGARAVDRVNQAKILGEQAQARYKAQEHRLKKARDGCHGALEMLGRRKLQVMDTEMRRFVASFSRLKNVQLTDVPSMAAFPQAELQAMQIQAIGFEAIDALKTLAASGAAGATAGFVSYGAVGALATASTGAAISGLSGVAAANATLAWFGGGALSAGGLGMAGGAWILGSIVTGPVLAIGGMVMSAKSKEALAKAKAQAAEAAEAIEQMKTIEAATSLIQSRAKQIFQILHRLWEELRQTLPELETIVSRETDWRCLRPEEQQAVAVITSLAYLLKQLIDAPLFDAAGKPVDDTLKLVNAAKLRLEGAYG